MVDLNRRIAISRAQQGGFSSIALPGDIGYDFTRIVIYSDGAATRCTDDGVVVGPDDVNPWGDNGFGTAAWNAGPIMYSTGGPFNEPYFRYLHKVRAAGSPLVVGTSDYTWEGWFRQREDVGLSLWPILTQYINPDELFTGPGYFITIYIETITNNRIDVLGGDSFATFWGVGANIDSSAFSDWMHIAVARRNGELRFWSNGSRITGASANTFHTNPLPIGEDYTSSIMQHIGIDVGQIRLTKDKAIYWDDTFALPTAPFLVP